MLLVDCLHYTILQSIRPCASMPSCLALCHPFLTLQLQVLGERDEYKQTKRNLCNSFFVSMHFVANLLSVHLYLSFRLSVQSVSN